MKTRDIEILAAAAAVNDYREQKSKQLRWNFIVYLVGVVVVVFCTAEAAAAVVHKAFDIMALAVFLCFWTLNS